MSYDCVDVTSVVLDIPAGVVIDPASLVDAGMSVTAALLAAASTQGTQGGSAESAPSTDAPPATAEVLSTSGTSVPLQDSTIAAVMTAELLDLGDLPDEGFPGFGYDDEISPDNGSVTVYEPPINAPEGYYAEDLYEIEFVHNYWTGELTIYLHFVLPTIDDGQMNEAYTMDSAVSYEDILAIEPGVEEIVSLQQNRGGSRCTVTMTRTTTQNSGGYTVNFNTGVVSGSRTMPSSSTTTTTTVTVEGTLVNGRCVIQRGR